MDSYEFFKVVDDGSLEHLMSYIDDYPLLKKHEELKYAKQILFYKRLIIARLCRLPQYKGCIEEKLEEAYKSDKCQSRTAIIIREKNEEENQSNLEIREKLGSCLETISKLNPYICSNTERPTQRRKAKRRLLNEFSYTHRFISDLVKDLKQTELEPEHDRDVARIMNFYEKYERAFDIMVCSNIRLAYNIAKKYIGRKVPFPDLVKEGCLGLMAAVEKFKYVKGYRFSTHATYWIKQAITRAIYDKSELIRIPLHVREQMGTVWKAEKHLIDKGIFNPDSEQIAEITKIPIKDIEFIKRMKCRKILFESQRKEEITSIFNRLRDGSSEDPSDSYADLKDKITELLETLNEREKKILELRYGIKDGIFRTLEQLSHVFKITRERVRQLEAKALKKLRIRAKGLENHL